MDLRPPKNSRGHLLGDPVANFCFSTIYAAIPSDPWSYKTKANINQMRELVLIQVVLFIQDEHLWQ